MIDPKFAAANAGWFIAVGLTILVAVWFAEQIRMFISYQRGSAPKPSPIAVGDAIYVDMDAVTDEIGAAKIDNLYSVALCLQVWNKSEDGKTLRGLTASIYQQSFHRIRLPFRDARNDVVDLKNGDLELVEIGRVLIASEPGEAPAAPRGGRHKQRVSLADINYAFNPERNARTLMVSGNKAFGIVALGQSASNHKPTIVVVLSATDVPSLEVRLQINLWAESPYDWLTIVSKGVGDA